MPTRERHTPELLAPAGGAEAFRAAVANGADAVYLGLDVLNARRGAGNFAREDLPGICRYAHLRGVSVYLTANVVVLPGEMSSALELVDSSWAAGVDAVIVQDLGLLRAIRAELPHVRIHASTQINSHNSATIRLLADAGVSRVTLAREVSLEEIADFARMGVVEIESFVHGALCMCYSGQCLMSSLIGRRSANRGLCAQPCRLPYELHDTSGRLVETPGAHLLSPKDLAGISILPRLVDAGVAALKIEGRMKSPEYVALVTGVYRAALDRAFAGPDEYEVRDGERSVLAEAFSRGFTEAYLLGDRGNEMMSYRRPNNRGVPVGRVSAVQGSAATVALDEPIDADDVIEFWTSAGRFAQTVGEITVSGAPQRTAPARSKASLAVERPVSVGDRVFRVRNASLATAARRTFIDADEVAKTPASFHVRVVEGEPLHVEVRDGQGRAGVADGPVVERARTKAVTAEEVFEHVGRLGGTPYVIDEWQLDLSPGVGVGFSALHRARREAVEGLERRVLEPWADRRRADPETPRPKTPRMPRPSTPALVVAVEDAKLVRACVSAGADAVHVPTYALLSDTDRAGARTVPLIPRVLHDREVRAALAHVREGARVVVGNLGMVREAAALGAAVEAHWSLNAVNALSVSSLADKGATFVWLSPELSGRQIAEVATTSVVPVGTAVYGRQELMVTEHCILMAEGECDRRCGACDRRSRSTVLRDRKGYEFPVRTDVMGRSHVYNSVPLDLTGALQELLASGIAALRIDLPVESAEQAAEIVQRVRAAVGSAAAEIDVEPAAPGPSTSGHFFRGVY